MSLEIVTPDDGADMPPPPPPAPETTDDGAEGAELAESEESPAPVLAAPAAPTPPVAPAARRGRPPKAAAAPASGTRSADLDAVRRQEARTLRELVETFGPEGSFTCRISRRDPEYVRDPVTGKNVMVRGFLESVDRAIDEVWIQQKYGGGTYELMFRQRNTATGQFKEAVNRTVTIAGDPDLNALPQVSIRGASGAPSSSGGNDGPVVTKAMDMMAKMATDAIDRAGERSTANDPVIGFLRDELANARAAQAEMMREMREMRESMTRPAPPTREESFKDSMLGKLLDTDSARLQAVRIQYESELRAGKEAAIDNEKRLEDRHDRAMEQQRLTHQRELDLARQSYETNLSAARSSFETQIQAVKSAFETKQSVLESDNRRLERSNADLQGETKELRAKKEKSIGEQVKEINALKELVGDGDGEKEGMGEKIADMLTNPDALTALGKIIRGDAKPGAAPAQAATEPAAEAPRRKVAKDADGNRYIVDGNKIRPAKGKPIPGSAPGEPDIPNIPPEQVQLAVGFLERAYTGGQDPEIVAVSVRANVPDYIIAAVRDVGGIDAFMTKVAKLPGSSPLSSSQAARNWLRKVGKVLVGD